MPSTDVRQKVFRVPANIVISVGLSWDFIGPAPVDLDLSAVCFTKDGQFVDVVFFNHLFPEGTDEKALRSEFLVDPAQLPYMFLSGDSTIGGEEENRMSGGKLARRRRRQEMEAQYGRGAGALVADSNGPGDVAENIFDRLYEEEQLDGVQEAVDEAHMYGGDVYDEGGELVRRAVRRELSDEVITFVMHKIPDEAEVIFLCVTSYTGIDFTVLNKARLVIYNETTSERVGTIDLKANTGNGTANLACMLMRVPPADPLSQPHLECYTDCWDLREVNIRAFGYTFVDVLPIMMDVAGVARNSRMDALHNLQDLSLRKKTGPAGTANEHLSDVRFGVGWRGEHDIDAFLVMLDENNNYVDHVYPKYGKLLSRLTENVARHSGDALSGNATDGDAEFVDLMAYGVPSQVRTICVGATYMESFGSEKDKLECIYDVPSLYLRLQNRSPGNPYSVELDRWNVSKYDEDDNREQARRGSDEAENIDDAATRREGKSKRAKKHSLGSTYNAPDGSKQPVRTLLLGVMLKNGEAALEAFHPYQNHNAGLSALGVDARAEEGSMAPVFEFVPIHQYVPVDPRNGFSNVIPFMQCVASFIWGGSSGMARLNGSRGGGANNNGAVTSTSEFYTHDRGDGTVSHTLIRENNMVGWDVHRATAVGEHGALGVEFGNIWEEMGSKEHLTETYAVEVRFLKVLELQPQLPHKFKCHGEAWVYGKGGVLPVGSAASAHTVRPFKTPFLVNRQKLSWDEDSSAAATTFLVHRYDRLRVMLYEFAAFGYADVDLMQLSALWTNMNPGSKGDGASVDVEVDLQGGGHLSKGSVRLRLTRVSKRNATRKLEREAMRSNRRREQHAAQTIAREEGRHNEDYNPCSFM